MPQTVFAGKMKIKNPFLNAFFGNNGHVHDGQDEDGSAPLVNLNDHVSGSPKWITKAAAYTAVDGDNICVDTSTSSFLLTLPLTPTVGDTVKVRDRGGMLSQNNLTVGRNGENIMGLAENMTVNQDGVGFELVYTGSTIGWGL